MIYDIYIYLYLKQVVFTTIYFHMSSLKNACIGKSLKRGLSHPKTGSIFFFLKCHHPLWQSSFLHIFTRILGWGESTKAQLVDDEPSQRLRPWRWHPDADGGRHDLGFPDGKANLKQIESENLLGFLLGMFDSHWFSGSNIDPDCCFEQKPGNVTVPYPAPWDINQFVISSTSYLATKRQGAMASLPLRLENARRLLKMSGSQ